MARALDAAETGRLFRAWGLPCPYGTPIALVGIPAYLAPEAPSRQDLHGKPVTLERCLNWAAIAEEQDLGWKVLGVRHSAVVLAIWRRA